MSRSTIVPIKDWPLTGAVGDNWDSVVGSGQTIEGPGSIYDFRGGKAMRLNKSLNAAAYNQIQLTASAKRIVVASGYFQVRTATAVGQASIIVMNATVSHQLQLAASGGNATLRSNCGTSGTVATISLNQWYLLDLLADSSTATASLAWMLDLVPQATASSSQTAKDFDNLRLGNTGTTSSSLYDVVYAGWVMTHTAADYPIGPLSPKRSLMVAA